MMNPHMAEDIAVLQQHLISTTTERRVVPRIYNTIPTGPGRAPVVYLSLPKYRKGLRNHVDAGRAEREIIEQVLGPNASGLRNAFFEHLHPCFPVLDHETFADMWTSDCNSISSTLVCDLYASALQVWGRSIELRQQTRPDPCFIWDQAVAALRDDFMAPTISTVHAAVLDLLGRPVIGITGNIVNAGRVVTLAQSLGLHRDPCSWKAAANEKNVRINLWWGVLIHDYWSSICHGIPPTLNSQYYDVPLPASEGTSDKAQDQAQCQDQSSNNTTFVHLCKLSEILGDILSLVYSLHQTPDDTQRRLRKMECTLDDWVLDLPDQLRPTCTTQPPINGSSNLWLAYLSVKMLVHRVHFKAILEKPDHTLEARQYSLVMLKNAASDVVDFVISLTASQFQEFWMPYTSYLLVISATVLLRCTIESNDIGKKEACAAKLVGFRESLQTARDLFQWDLADFCLERCGEPIQKIAQSLELSTGGPQTASPHEAAPTSTLTASGLASPFSLSMNDLISPINSLEYPWETLWGDLDGSFSMEV